MLTHEEVLPHLARDRRPHFERVVVGAADNQVSAELQTRDHVIIVTLQHLREMRTNTRVQSDSVHINMLNAWQSAVYHGFLRVPVPPGVLDAVLTNVGRLPRTDRRARPAAS